MDRLKLDGWCEKAILGLVVAIVGFSALATGAVRPQDFVVVHGVFIALYAIYQFLSGSDHVWSFVRAEIYGRRGSGSFLSPNSCAAYLGMIFPLGLAYTMTGRLGHLQRVLFGYATLVIFG